MSTNESPGESPFDLAVPYRPGTADFNGIAKEDDDLDPVPDPITMPNAPEWNEMSALLVAYGKIVPVATFSISGGATPAIASFAALSNNVSIPTFTVTHNGTGDVSITWPANTFPPPGVAPKAHLNAGPGMIHATAISNGVRVKTYNGSAAATDLDFTVDVF